MTERDEILRDLGKQTAQIRESRGITLEDVFDKTRIRMEYLRGMHEREWIPRARQNVVKAKEDYENTDDPEIQAEAHRFANENRQRLIDAGIDPRDDLFGSGISAGLARANLDYYNNGYPKDLWRAVEEKKNAWGSQAVQVLGKWRRSSSSSAGNCI